jgi:hypothetical protein
VLGVAVTNIGMGPALNIEASARLLDAEGKPSLAPTRPQTPALMAGLAAGTGSTLELEVSRPTDAVNIELTILYLDVAGKAWETVGSYLDARERYEGLDVRRPAE